MLTPATEIFSLFRYSFVWFQELKYVSKHCFLQLFNFEIRLLSLENRTVPHIGQGVLKQGDG